MKIFEKIRKKFILYQNKVAGSNAERNYVAGQVVKGNKVERTGHGSDYKVIENYYTSTITGKKTREKYVEVKSSATAPLSPLQNKMKKNTKNYEVHRP